MSSDNSAVITRDVGIINLRGLHARAAAKLTWPDFWSNAVCSHPQPREAFAEPRDDRLETVMAAARTVRAHAQENELR